MTGDAYFYTLDVHQAFAYGRWKRLTTIIIDAQKAVQSEAIGVWSQNGTQYLAAFKGPNLCFVFRQFF
jgi:hypothetical protein